MPHGGAFYLNIVLYYIFSVLGRGKRDCLQFVNTQKARRGCGVAGNGRDPSGTRNAARARRQAAPQKIICFLLASGLKDSIPYDNSCEELFFALLKSSFSLCSKK